MQTITEMEESLVRMQIKHLESLRSGDATIATMRKDLCESIASRIRAAKRATK